MIVRHDVAVGGDDDSGTEALFWASAVVLTTSTARVFLSLLLLGILAKKPTKKWVIIKRISPRVGIRPDHLGAVNVHDARRGLFDHRRETGHFRAFL